MPGSATSVNEVYRRMPGRWDLVVIGAGPAGAAAARVVARTGWDVLLVDRVRTAGNKFGESLPPAAVTLIERLLGPLTEANRRRCGLARTSGNIARWQSCRAELTDFFFTPAGHGLAVDRQRFDSALVRAAVDAGARFSPATRLRRCRRDPDLSHPWRIELGHASGRADLRSRYLVDASGKASALARELGAERYTLDRLLACGRRLVSSEPDDDRHTRIEAVENGWWYSQRIPGSCPSRRMVVFHTDRDLPAARLAARPLGFARLLAQTRHLKTWLSDRGYRPEGKIRGACAASSRLSQFAGDGWLAVGDAAHAFDPLSSQGISKALAQGVEAGHLVGHALAGKGGDREMFKAFAQRQASRWLGYLEQLQHFYQSQPRWPDSPFWNRRRLAQALKLRDAS